MSDTASPPPPGRTIDIELGGQEVITVELDSLDPSPDDLIDVLREGQCKVGIWMRLAAEYWRRGLLDAADKIAQAAKTSAYMSYSGILLHGNGTLRAKRGRVLRYTSYPACLLPQVKVQECSRVLFSFQCVDHRHAGLGGHCVLA